jgi:HK97 gp10 family phage protein
MQVADMIDGFTGLILDLENLSGKIDDKETKQKALEAGAEPIINRSKRIAAQHRRAGVLEEGIVSQIDNDANAISIGWSKSAFYGKYLDDGFTHRGGKFVQIPHLKASYEAEKEKALNNMIEVYKKSLS